LAAGLEAAVATDENNFLKGIIIVAAMMDKAMCLLLQYSQAKQCTTIMQSSSARKSAVFLLGKNARQNSPRQAGMNVFERFGILNVALSTNQMKRCYLLCT